MAEILEKQGTIQNPYGKKMYGERYREHCSKTTCDKCKKLFAFVHEFGNEVTKVYYCVDTSRMSLREVIKIVREAGPGKNCCTCKYWGKRISYERCYNCLMTEDLCNFEIRQDL